MKDITYCASVDCPSKDCKIKILNNKFEPDEVVSMADFSETCRYYMGWLVKKDNAYDKLYKALTDTSQNTAREFLNMQLGNVFGIPSSTEQEENKP